MPSSQLLDYASAFRALTDVIDTGALIVAPDRELVFISDRARELVGCEPGDDLEACTSTVTPLFERALDRADEQPYRETIKDEQQLPDGYHPQRLVIEAHVLYGDETDDPEAREGYLVLLKDGDSIERLEETLRRATTMSHTRRLYEAMAHDLRQPTSAALVYLDVLEEVSRHVADDETRAQGVQATEILRSELRDLNQSLSTLLSEIVVEDDESGVTNLTELMQGVARLVRPQVRQDNVTLARDLVGRAIYVAGQRHPLKQALLNLTTNALEAMPEGGTLTLRLTPAGDASDVAVVEVADDGTGIPPEVQARMFDLHFTTKDEGTGIGLHTVKQTVERLGGEIEIDSTLGEGTTVRLRLPCAGPSMAAPGPLSSDAAP